MVMWIIQLSIVLAAILTLHIGFWSGYLARMPGGWFEHAYLIVLLLIPMGGPWYLKAYIALLWTAGIWAYLDDLYQHWRRTWQPDYKSPLHIWGCYTLKPFIEKYLT